MLLTSLRRRLLARASWTFGTTADEAAFGNRRTTVCAHAPAPRRCQGNGSGQVRHRAFAGMTVVRLVTVAIWLGTSFPTLAAAQVAVDWVQPTRGVSIALDAADNLYTVDYEQALGAEMTLTKRNAGGQLLWTARFDQTSSTAWERASWVATDSAGNAIVCGTLMSGYSNPVEAASVVMKFGPSGLLAWRRVYESSFDGSSVRKCLVDGSDNVYVLGMGSGPAGRVTKVKKFAADGTPLWSFFDSAGIGAALNFKLTPDGNLLITGKSIYGSYLGYAKVNLNGQLIWALPGVASLTAGDSAGDLFGNTYLVHGQYVLTNPGTVIKKLNPSGALIWERVYGLSGFRIEVGNDHQAVVSGFPNSGSPGAAFMKVDGNGALLWANLDADGPLGLLAHAHMLLDAANDAYLAAGTMSEMAVSKVNSDGTAGWTQTIPFGYAQAIALGRTDNSVYVVGGTTARLLQAAPSVPTRPTVLSYFALTPTSAYLGWSDNSSNETGFTVERCTGMAPFCDATPGAWAVRTTTGANMSTFNDTTLAPATTYSWRVSAFNSAGRSAYTNTLSLTTPGDPAAPAAPTGLTAQARRVKNRAEVRLAWVDNATSETGYVVERCSGTGCTNFAGVANLSANTKSYTDAALPRGVTFRYRVMATATAGNSGYSNIATVTTP